jgi:hypothetical protein
MNRLTNRELDMHCRPFIDPVRAAEVECSIHLGYSMPPGYSAPTVDAVRYLISEGMDPREAYWEAAAEQGQLEQVMGVCHV